MDLCRKPISAFGRLNAAARWKRSTPGSACQKTARDPGGCIALSRHNVLLVARRQAPRTVIVSGGVHDKTASFSRAKYRWSRSRSTSSYRVCIELKIGTVRYVRTGLTLNVESLVLGEYRKSSLSCLKKAVPRRVRVEANVESILPADF